MKEDLLKIIDHYGLDHQLKYIHSEYFELDEAIIEEQCDESGYHYFEENIAEEIADVMVMLKQFQYYFGITDEQIEEVMRFKIDRQLSRIEKEGE